MNSGLQQSTQGRMGAGGEGLGMGLHLAVINV